MATALFFSLLFFNQYFGQNKIQYKDFNFKILNTEHFDIYFSQGGEDLAVFAEDVLEDGYRQLNEDFGTEVDFRIPVIIYNSPNDFSQTNVTLELIEEAVGGFTEIMKNRMVIPFNGDYEEFRHVLSHELTHVFQFVIFFSSRLEALFSGDIMYSIPLWVMEGNAEFESQGWNIEADIYMRDLIMNNKVIPLVELGNYNGYIIYKEGQAFYNFVVDKYGREKIGEFIHLLKTKKNLENTFLATFGLTVDEFNIRWIRYYQLKYWPNIQLAENFTQFARVIYDHKKTNTLLNTSPSISPQGDKIAFITDRQGTVELILFSSIDGRVLKRLLRAEYSSGYEGLHLYQGGVSWSPDEKYLCFAAKSRGSDALYVINARSGKVYKKLRLKLDAIYSPQFSPDNETVAFSGLKNGYLDIYKINLETGQLGMITNDIYADKQPSFGPNGSVLFVSDRPDSSEEYHFGSYAVFLADAGRFGRITPRSSYVASPFFNPDSGIFFVADYDSAYNLYYYSSTAGAITKRTDFLTGMYYPSISKNGTKIAFVYYNEYGYDVCVVKDPIEKLSACDSLRENIKDQTFEEITLEERRIKKYRPRFTFDYIVASASYYTPLGLSGLTEIGLSDILGNHQIRFSTDFYGNLSSSDIFVDYWYLKKRADFGITIFQYLNYFADYRDLVIWRYLGAGGIAQYPLSTIFRTELGFYAYKVYEERWLDFFPYYESFDREDTSYTFYYPELSFIYDDAKWGEIGPLGGRRARITGYSTVFSDFDIKVGILDYRRYFRLSPRASLAAKLVLAGNFGRDEELWSIGGPGTLRGYDYYTFTGSDLGFLNLEYRFPFIDRLKIAFPLPIEITSIRGVLFADFGAVYSDSFAATESSEGFPPVRWKDVKMGLGAGLRINLSFIIFKLDFARANDLHNWVDNDEDPGAQRSLWKWYLTIGPEW